MEPNVELLNEVMDFIEEHPRQHNQKYIWLESPSRAMFAKLLRRPAGGSVGCFGGWTAYLSAPGVRHNRFNALAEAEYLLGLSSYETSWLFSPTRTREELRRYVDAVTALEEAKHLRKAAQRGIAQMEAIKAEAEWEQLVEVDVMGLERVLERA